MNDLQKKLLEIMKVFHSLCEAHNLRYFMLGGTLLGAVRHKGFIPWDDDIDVGMPREDFEKFIRISNEKLPDFVEIQSYDSQEVVLSATIKFVHKKTTLIEKGQIKPLGVFIDVFPLDGAGNTKLGSYLHFKRIRLNKFLLLCSARGTCRKVLNYVLKKIGNRKIFNHYDKVMKKKTFYKSKYAGLLIGAWGIKEVNLSKDYSERLLLEFEGEKFYAPVNYDRILRRAYGDYMCLPPKEKQKSHHNFNYVNLELPYEQYSQTLK